MYIFNNDGFSTLNVILITTHEPPQKINLEFGLII